MPRKSSAAKAATAHQPKKRRGCLGRMFIGVAALFGLLIAFSIVMGVIQSVGQSVGLLPTRAPTPTRTAAPTFTPAPTEPPTVVAEARGGAGDALALAPADAAEETPAAIPSDTPITAPTDAPPAALADTATSATRPTAAPTNTPTVAPTNTARSTPTRTPTPTPMPTVPPTNTPAAAPAAIPMASGNANLRAGPGTDYAVVGGLAAGDPLEITGVSGDGGWYQLGSGVWIAGSLVAGAPSTGLPVVAAPPPPTLAPTPTALPQRASEPVPIAEPTAPPASGGAPGGQWPAYSCTETPAPPDPNCPIKGNINSSGERIYHMPGQQAYCRTEIDAGKGERWFCSADEAEAAGWRAAQR